MLFSLTWKDLLLTAGSYQLEARHLAAHAGEPLVGEVAAHCRFDLAREGLRPALKGVDPALILSNLGSVCIEEVIFYLVNSCHLPALKPVQTVSYGATVTLLPPAGCPVSQACRLHPATCQCISASGTNDGTGGPSESWPSPALKTCACSTSACRRHYMS